MTIGYLVRKVPIVAHIRMSGIRPGKRQQYIAIWVKGAKAPDFTMELVGTGCSVNLYDMHADFILLIIFGHPDVRTTRMK